MEENTATGAIIFAVMSLVVAWAIRRLIIKDRRKKKENTLIAAKKEDFASRSISVINWLDENWKIIAFIIIAILIASWIIDPYIHPTNYSPGNGFEPPPSWCSGIYCD